MTTLLKYSVGIDISQKDFSACISGIDSEQKVKIKATRKFANTGQGFQDLLVWVDKHRSEAIAVVFMLEATGVYYENLAWYLFDRERVVIVVVPSKAKKYFQSLGQKSKNDKIDSQALARMGAEQNHRPWQPISKSLYELRGLTRQNESLQNLKTQISNQIHALEHSHFEQKFVRKQLEKTLELLKKQIEAVQSQIEKTIEADSELAQKVANIAVIKGVGVLTIATILAETNGFASIEEAGQLVSYAGYDVIENQSGNFVGKTRISKKGNGHIRRALYLPALSVVRYKQKPFVQLYERVYERTKIKMKGYVAVQKKLLVLIYTLWKKNEKYQADYQNPLNQQKIVAVAEAPLPKVA
jgi:transposase